MKKKILSILLSAFMMLMVLPETVFAATKVNSIDVSIETGYGEAPEARYDEITPDNLTTSFKSISYEYKDSNSVTPATLIEGDYTVNVTVELKDIDKSDYSLIDADVTVNGSDNDISNLYQLSDKITFTYSFHVDAPPVTIASILPDDFPVNDDLVAPDNAWVNSSNSEKKIYVQNNRLQNGIKTLLLSTPLTLESENTYVFDDNPLSGKFTFKVQDGKAISIELKDYTYLSEAWNGIYTAPVQHDLIISKSDGTAQKGTDYNWNGFLLEIMESGLTISGTSTKESIQIPSNSNATDVTFKDLTLTTNLGSPLFRNDKDADITINVIGTSSISSDGAPAFLNDGHKTTFSGEGDLTIESNDWALFSSELSLNMTGNLECKSTNVNAIMTNLPINVNSNIGKIVLRGKGNEDNTFGAVYLYSGNPITNIFNLADGVSAFGSDIFDKAEDNITGALNTCVSEDVYYLSLNSEGSSKVKSVIIKKTNDNEPSPGPSSTPDPTPSYKIPNTGVEGTPTNNHSLLKLSSLSLLAIGTYMAIKKKKDN